MRRLLLLPLLCCAVVYVSLLTAAAPAPGKAEIFRRSLVSTGDPSRLQHVMDNQPGMGYRVTQALAMEGLNLKGISTVVVGNQVGIYVALDTPQDAEKTVRVLQRAM